MKKLLFCDAMIDSVSDCIYIDLLATEDSNYLYEHNNCELISLEPILNECGSEWCKEFSAWLGKFNCLYGNLYWWAHTSTAKNLLSSPLGERYLQVKAICKIAKYSNINTICILGATTGQMESIVSVLSTSEYEITGKAWRQRKWKSTLNNIKALARQPLLDGQLFFGFFGYKYPQSETSNDICLFTYIDGVQHVGTDNYFGKLPKLLNNGKSVYSINYLAYVYTPFRKRLRE